MQVHFLNVEYIFQKAYEMLLVGDGRGLLYLFLALFNSFLDIIAPISFIVCVLCIAGIVYCHIRIHQIHHIEHEMMHGHAHAHGEGAHGHEGGQGHEMVNKQWEKVLEHIHSAEESNWRLAILEADIMLDEMLEAQGYHQDTLGDKLKSIERSDFTNIDAAWEAHLVRNQIAHEGTAFALTHREAKRVIGLYEKVFKEFRLI